MYQGWAQQWTQLFLTVGHKCRWWQRCAAAWTTTLGLWSCPAHCRVMLTDCCYWIQGRTQVLNMLLDCCIDCIGSIVEGCIQICVDCVSSPGEGYTQIYIDCIGTTGEGCTQIYIDCIGIIGKGCTQIYIDCIGTTGEGCTQIYINCIGTTGEGCMQICINCIGTTGEGCTQIFIDCVCSIGEDHACICICWTIRWQGARIAQSIQWLDCGFSSWLRQGVFLFSKMCRLALGLTHQGFFPGG